MGIIYKIKVSSYNQFLTAENKKIHYTFGIYKVLVKKLLAIL